jgi:hypothetical protein
MFFIYQIKHILNISNFSSLVRILIVNVHKSFRYNIKWYITPIRIQKMLLFLLQRNVRDFTVNIGRLFVPSLEGFATVKTI